MSLKGTVYLGRGVHVWRDALAETDDEGLVIDVIWQSAEGSTPALEVRGARIPDAACDAIARWVNERKGRRP